MTLARLRSRAPESAKAKDLLEQAEGLDESYGAMSAMDYDPTTRKSTHYRSYDKRQRRTK